MQENRDVDVERREKKSEPSKVGVVDHCVCCRRLRFSIQYTIAQ